MTNDEKLAAANIAEKYWADCYIADDGTIFMPQIDRETGAVIKNGEEVYKQSTDQGTLLSVAKQAKLAEISVACQAAIYAGVDAADTKGTEHFSLSMADQTNLSALASVVAQGAASVPYHADGQLCREFTVAEFSAVYSAAKGHITKNTTLCNHLNVWIRRCTTAAEISAITYTSILPDDLLANYNVILAAAWIGTGETK